MRNTDEASPVEELVGRVLVLRGKVDAAVHENFGYCPKETWFDNLLVELREAEAEFKATDPTSYAAYAARHY